MIRNATDTANIFAIDGVAQPTLVLTEGNTYYFDLSDSSLYNADTSKNHQLKFSETENGTHSSGSAYTTGVTTSASYIEIGTTGAYIQIVVATGAPELFYYCVNHSGMGGAFNVGSSETVQYQQRAGFSVQNRTEDPMPYAQALADDPYGGVWSSGGTLNTARSAVGRSGIAPTQNAAMCVSGYPGPPSTVDV